MSDQECALLRAVKAALPAEGVAGTRRAVCSVYGTIDVIDQGVGGPPPGQKAVVAGDVVVTLGGFEVAQAPVAASARVRLDVLPGVYSVALVEPSGDLRDTVVRVRPAKTTTVRWHFDLP